MKRIKRAIKNISGYCFSNINKQIHKNSALYPKKNGNLSNINSSITRTQIVAKNL